MRRTMMAVGLVGGMILAYSQAWAAYPFCGNLNPFVDALLLVVEFEPEGVISIRNYVQTAPSYMVQGAGSAATPHPVAPPPQIWSCPTGSLFQLGVTAVNPYNGVFLGNPIIAIKGCLSLTQDGTVSGPMQMDAVGGSIPFQVQGTMNLSLCEDASVAVSLENMAASVSRKPASQSAGNAPNEWKPAQ